MGPSRPSCRKCCVQAAGFWPFPPSPPPRRDPAQPPIDQPSYRATDRAAGRPSGRPSDRAAERSIERPSDRSTERASDRATGTTMTTTTAGASITSTKTKTRRVSLTTKRTKVRVWEANPTTGGYLPGFRLNVGIPRRVFAPPETIYLLDRRAPFHVYPAPLALPHVPTPRTETEPGGVAKRNFINSSFSTSPPSLLSNIELYGKNKQTPQRPLPIL